MMKSVMIAAIAAVAAAAGGAELTVEICRQNGHMTSEQAPLAVKDGKAEFRLASCYAEKGNYLNTISRL